MIKVFLLWLAFSVRSPNIDPNPADYEFTGGYEIEDAHIISDLELMTERENGVQYFGREFNFAMTYLSYGEYIKSARDINRQTVALKYPIVIRGFEKEFARIDMGVAETFNEYRHSAVGAHMKIKSANVDAEITGFEELQFFKLTVHHRFLSPWGIYLEPDGTYYYDGKNEDYKFKVKIGFKIK